MLFAMFSDSAESWGSNAVVEDDKEEGTLVVDSTEEKGRKWAVLLNSKRIVDGKTECRRTVNIIQPSRSTQLNDCIFCTR